MKVESFEVYLRSNLPMCEKKKGEKNMSNADIFNDCIWFLYSFILIYFVCNGNNSII